MEEKTIEEQLAELETAEAEALNTAESTDTDKGGNGKLTASQRKAADKAAKTPKYYLPFGKVIYSRPDRHFEVQRTNRKGEKTGAVGLLMCNLTIPLHGGMVEAKMSIWRDTQLNRETGMNDHTYSFSLPRNQFTIVDGHQALYDEWRQTVLDGYKVWRDTDAAKVPGKRASMSPRLVESSRPEPKSTTPA